MIAESLLIASALALGPGDKVILEVVAHPELSGDNIVSR